MKKVGAVFAVLAVLATWTGTASASSDGSGPPASPTISAIAWGPCADGYLRQAGARCAMLQVPLDYSDPAGTQIQLAISRVKHTVADADYQGVMLANPGGPGGSGLWTATLGAAVPNDAGDAYDWIGFDPRGVGASEPSLSCIPKYFHPNRPPYVPKTQDLESTWLARSQRYADACEADAPELLPHMSTIDSARDMDSIRQALGVEQINYYGFSYGTYLGQVYATLFPGRIRRAVFDSNVDPRNVFYQANLNQDTAFERNINIFFGWVAKHWKAYHLGRTPGAVSRLFYLTEHAVTRHPAGGIVGPDEWDDAFLLAGYAQFLWPYLADAFASWVNEGRPNKIIGWYAAADGVGNDNTAAVYNAVQCTDAPWPQDWATWKTDNWAVYQQAPFLTWGNAWFNAPCLYWAAPSGVPTNVNGGSTPVLLVDETLDAATPYEGSVYVRSVFPDSALIAVEGGTTHAGSLGGNACVDDAISAFLTTGALPARQPGDGPDLTCQPLPQPKPLHRSRASRPSEEMMRRLIPILAG